MNGLQSHSAAAQRLYDVNSNQYIDCLQALCNQETEASHYPLCQEISKKVPVYDLATFSSADARVVANLQDEWHAIMYKGPGVFVLKNFYLPNAIETLDSANRAFDKIIEDEASSTRGDHFASSNANSRIWNSLQKHAMYDPVSFVSYYSNPWLRHVSEAWLGPDFTVTAQVNIVRPGGKPQMPHRDYHLGFQTAEQCVKWPKTMHMASQFLTLQGAVAHSDMPLCSGPTRLLPFSQLLDGGYMAWRRDDVKDFFAKRWISLPLEKGDALFFNPALIHAAGENSTSVGDGGIDRSANLLQISSAFGKTMEKVDHDVILLNIWDELCARIAEHRLPLSEMLSIVSVTSDGYPFPTNLDSRPPAPGGMAPESQTELVLRLLKSGSSKKHLEKALEDLRKTSAP